MRVIGTLVFALAVIVNPIICPGFPAGFYPRDERIPPGYRTLIVTPEEYPGAHIRNRINGSLHLIELPFAVFVKGDIIAGRNFDGVLRAIYNSEGNVTIRNTTSQTTELFTIEHAQELGLMPYLEARARVLGRAPLVRSSSNTG